MPFECNLRRYSSAMLRGWGVAGAKEGGLFAAGGGTGYGGGLYKSNPVVDPLLGKRAPGFNSFNPSC